MFFKALCARVGGVGSVTFWDSSGRVLSHSPVECCRSSQSWQARWLPHGEPGCRWSDTGRGGEVGGERTEEGSFPFPVDNPSNIIKESAGWVTPNQTLTPCPTHTPLICYALCVASVNISISSECRLIPWKERKSDPGALASLAFMHLIHYSSGKK